MKKIDIGTVFADPVYVNSGAVGSIFNGYGVLISQEVMIDYIYQTNIASLSSGNDQYLRTVGDPKVLKEFCNYINPLLVNGDSKLG